MDKVKVYGSQTWPHCAPTKEYLLEKGLEFDYFDINEDDDARAEFLALRTKYNEYDEIVKAGQRFGIPAVFYNNEVVIGYNVEQLDHLLGHLYK